MVAPLVIGRAVKTEPGRVANRLLPRWVSRLAPSTHQSSLPPSGSARVKWRHSIAAISPWYARAMSRRSTSFPASPSELQAVHYLDGSRIKLAERVHAWDQATVRDMAPRMRDPVRSLILDSSLESSPSNEFDEAKTKSMIGTSQTPQGLWATRGEQTEGSPTPMLLVFRFCERSNSKRVNNL